MNISSITRRELLAGATALAARAATRPNILFLMADEFRYDALGAAGHPVVKTPHLDRLAREGTRFATTYTVSPVCAPARASLFTGRYAHVHGLERNNTAANNGEIFLPSILRYYGYHTAICGKLHFRPKRLDFGFDQFRSFSDEGPVPEKGYFAYLRRKHGSPAPFPKVPGSCPWPDDPLGKDVGLFRYPPEDFQSEWITDRAVEYLRGRRASAQPWFLFVSYFKPHSPSVEIPRYFHLYDPDKIPVPKLPPNIKELRAAAGGGKRSYVADERMERVMSAIYYGSVTHTDAQIGRVLAELERTGMADNTILVFMSDHGNMLGDHGRWFKGLMYEGSVRVPLLWRGPKGAPENTGSVHNELVENIDVLPSLLESIGAPVPEGVQGRSFLRLARGGGSGWKNRCYSQLWTGMIRTPEWKFIDKSRNLSGPFELYRMTDDPHENRNLAGESKYRNVIADFKRDITAWRADKPAPVRIKGMPLPGYAAISDAEREELLRTAPGRR